MRGGCVDVAGLGGGGRVGGLALGRVGCPVSGMRRVAAGTVAWAVLVRALSFARIPWVGCVLLLGCGCTVILDGAICNGLLQTNVPDALRGRMMAAYGLVVVGLSQVVGAFVGGSVAHVFGVAGSIGGAAVLMLAYGTWAFFRQPELKSL